MINEWINKESWKQTLPLIPFYQSRTNGKKGMDLGKMMLEEDHLTFMPNKKSGLAEIDVIPPEVNYKGWRNCSNRHKIKDLKIDEICQILLSEVYLYFNRLWDSKIHHTIFCSGGMDSRIMMYAINKLRENKDLGDYIIYCHQPEQHLFYDLMKELKIPEENYKVFKEGKEQDPDYYNYPDLSYNTNAYSGPAIQFHDDDLDTKKSCLVTGSFGGELMDYPTLPRNFGYWGINDMNLGLLLNFAESPTISYHEYYKNWNDILQPFLSYSYLEVAFNIPQKYFIQNDIKEGDLVRTTMLKILETKVPFYRGHNYNLKFSKEYKMRIKENFENSKFYKKFNFLSVVRNAFDLYDFPLFYKRNHLSSKMYGLASVFESIDHPHSYLDNPYFKDRYEARIKEDIERKKWLEGRK